MLSRVAALLQLLDDWLSVPCPIHLGSKEVRKGLVENQMRKSAVGTVQRNGEKGDELLERPEQRESRVACV